MRRNDVVAGVESPSDGDKSSSGDDDSFSSGWGLRGSMTPVLSSAARQAALKQLQQYQAAWRWSQQADD
jgi:hypothetical protein